ncbi:hypothetical protein FRX31_019667 [Thalictrum thalictroides]|uniref:Uncharacterized protein n=1 Tax=Thalictrum thalictroides TaxID=46969 RepID=A0A7J6W055_THATH|nr:hypothetical protein FRX31_019667 [Thalictrum thalictroides]
MEGRSTLRPANVLIYNWFEGKHACVDITWASPVVGFGKGIFMVGPPAIHVTTGDPQGSRCYKEVLGVANMYPKGM